MGTGHAGQRAGTKGAAETTTGQRENVDRSFTRRAAQAAEKRWGERIERTRIGGYQPHAGGKSDRCRRANQVRRRWTARYRLTPCQEQHHRHEPYRPASHRAAP